MKLQFAILLQALLLSGCQPAPELSSEDLQILTSREFPVDERTPCKFVDYINRNPDAVSSDRVRRHAKLNTVCRLPISGITLTEAEELLGGKDFNAQLTPNSLTIATRWYDEQKLPTACCSSLEGEFEQLGDADIWMKRYRVEDGDKAFFTFLPPLKLGPDAFSHLQRVIGEEASESSTIKFPKQISGTTYSDEIDSEILGERKEVFIYVPEGTEHKNLRVLFLTDGVVTPVFASVIEYGVSRNLIRPTVLVGVGPSEDRTSDYTKFDSQNYRETAAFYETELRSWVEERLPVSTAKADRVLAGFSSGGGFVIRTGLYGQREFGSIIAMSPSYFIDDDDYLVDEETPTVHLSGGTFETPFLESATDNYARMKDRGVAVELNRYYAGHNQDQWMVALYDALVDLDAAQD